MNVGPRADGTIPAIFQDRLLGLGEFVWLNYMLVKLYACYNAVNIVKTTVFSSYCKLINFPFLTGEWLNINGEAIYQSRPFKIQNDTITPDVW